MRLWRGLAAIGIGALVVATLAFAGTLLALGPSRVAAGDLIMVAYVAFYAGVFALVAATVARGTAQVRGALRAARRAN